MENNKLNHLGFILDGNRRYAKEHGITLAEGYHCGFNTLKTILEYVNKTYIDIKYITVFALSIDNIKNRKPMEINTLFDLLMDFNIDENYDPYIIKIIGSDDNLPQNVINRKNTIMNKYNTGKKQLNILFNYSFEYDIIETYKKMYINKVEDMNLSTLINYSLCNLPQIDLLIRTGGQNRISTFNFLLLQYCEIIFTNTLWPSLTTLELDSIILKYKNIKKNFGE